MIKLYTLLRSILKFIFNTVPLLQTILGLSIGVITLFALFHLAEIKMPESLMHMVDFCYPVVDFLWREPHRPEHLVFLGAVLVYDVIAFMTTLLCTAFRGSLQDMQNFFTDEIRRFTYETEKKINDELQQDYEKYLRNMTQATALIEFEVESAHTGFHIDEEQKELTKKQREVAVKMFCEAFKKIKSCHCESTDAGIILVLDDFTKFDNLLVFIDALLNKLRAELLSRHVIMNFYAAFDAYDNSRDIMEISTGLVNLLLKYKSKNEFLCRTPLWHRYEMEEAHSYRAVTKGSYRDDLQLWALVKKR